MYSLNLLIFQEKDVEIIENTLEDINYIENLRETYKKLKKHCENFSFCIDISDSAPPSSYNVYSNADIIIRKEIKLSHLKFLKIGILKLIKVVIYYIKIKFI